MMRKLPFVLLAMLISTPAMAGKKLAEPDIVEDALAFATRDRAKAIQLLEEAIARPENNDIATLLMLHAGEQHRLAGHGDEAHRWFAKVIEVQPKGGEVEASRLGLALVSAGERKPDSSTLSVLEDVSHKTALATQNADRYLVLALVAARQNDPTEAKKLAKEALEWAEEDPEVLARVETTLERLTQDKPVTVTVPPITGPKEQLSLVEKAERSWQEGRADEARELAREVLDTQPDTPDAQVATYLLRRMDSQVHADKIGLLLPTEGKYAGAARALTEAFELGYGSPGPSLVIENSGEDAEQAVLALEKLSFDQGVVAVVGPLRKDVTDPVLRAAEAMRVPIVSLAQVDAILEGDQWTFQGMTTPRAQVDALVEHLMGVESMTAFAIFAPDNPYGHTAADAFTAAVEAREGAITVAEYYDAESTDLIPAAQKLGRKDYEARKREFYDLRKAAEETGANPDRVVLPPVLDFQGLFLPDKASRVPLACAALSYEEFPVGHFQTVKDGPTVPLLGLSSWNNASLVTAGNVYVRSSRFTDIYYGEAEASLAFAEAYKQSTGRTPTALEAASHAVGQLVGQAASSEASDRDAFREALLGVQLETPTVTGATGFDAETRAATHEVLILTMDEETILPVELPQPAEGEEGTGEAQPG